MEDATSGEGVCPGVTVGDVVAGRYQLLEALSGSPLRSVFRAYDQEVEVEVALWLIRSEMFGGDALATAAADAMRRVRDPNVLRLFDSGIAEVGELPHQLYLAWQLGTSASLESLLASGTPASHSQFWRLSEGLANALQAGHDKGLVHGWLSPADVVEVAGQVKLCGLGLLAKLDAKWVIPHWGDTTRYVAPEMLDGGGPTRMSDWYSLGAVLLDLATGMRASSFDEARAELGEADPQLLAAIEPCLRPVAADRPNSADALLEAIRIACGKSEEQPPISSTIVDDMFSPPRGVPEVGGLLFEDDDATEVHVPASEFPSPLSEQLASADRGVALDSGTTLDSGTPSQSAAAASENAVAPSENAAAPLDPAPLAAVSMKPAEPAKPRTGPLKSPVKPKLRSLSSLPGAAAARQDLGTYAPRRAPTEGKKRRQTWLLLALALAAGGASVSVVLALRSGSSSDAGAGKVQPASGALNPEAAIAARPQRKQAPPAAVLAPCPDAMVLHTQAGSPGFCIDAYESPGAGRRPQSGMGLDEAAAQCSAAEKRLCSSAEWEESCRDHGASSWPYGARYDEEICNVASGQSGPAGAFSRCQTSLGVYDMSGNVAEWVANGEIRGGSASDRSKGRCSQVRPNPDVQEAYSDVGFRCCVDAIDSKGQTD
mgnify:CR=1 FL=1